MIEKDNIQELFSKAFENQSAAVKPELWAGVQAKMAAAGVASTATVATKGLSALTKWIIGSAAVGTVGVVTAVVALNSGEEQANKQKDAPKEIARNTTVTTPEESTAEQTSGKENTYTAKTEKRNSEVPLEEIQQATNPSGKEHKSTMVDPEEKVIMSVEPIKVDKAKSEAKTTQDNHSKQTVTEAKEHKETKRTVPPVDKKKVDVKETPSTEQTEYGKESVNPENAVKIAEFPNIFTPDGDKVNDTYIVKVENIVDFKMTITDQNNRTLFQTSDPNEGWDGKVGGDDAKPGSYAVFIDGKDLNGKPFQKAQIFQLYRR